MHHPDKESGDEATFMKIKKAYDTLTDPKMYKNWELYGNPDGIPEIVFGFAIPSWMVDREHSVLLLLIYMIVVLGILPGTCYMVYVCYEWHNGDVE